MLNKDLVFIYDQLCSIQARNLVLKAKVAFTLERDIQILLPIVKDYINARINLLSANGTHNEAEDTYSVDADKVEEVTSQLDGLDNIEIDNISLVKIKMQDIENLEISINEAKALGYLIEEES